MCNAPDEQDRGSSVLWTRLFNAFDFGLDDSPWCHVEVAQSETIQHKEVEMVEIATAYRSKDKEFMLTLKKSVIKGMKGHDVEDKKEAWDYMKRRVIMDDLHKFAIEKLGTDEPVQMGVGDLRSRLLVLTMKPIVHSKVAREFTERIIEAGKFKHVYYTSKFKTDTILKSQKQIFEEILESEIKVLKPKAILAFGEVFSEYGLHEVKEHLGIPILQTDLISPIIKSEDEDFVKEKKNIIWNDVKQIRKHYTK
jgi:hypothetical protein